MSQFWNDLSSHITNNLPNIYVSLQDNNNNLSHYKISEKLSGGSKETEFSISEYKVNLSVKNKDKFLDKVKSVENKINEQISAQTGGAPKRKQRKQTRSRHKDSSSSSSDSDSDSDSDDYYNFTKYKKLTQPISMWYYTPTLYNVNSVFIPTFTAPIIPYVKLWLPMFN